MCVCVCACLPVSLCTLVNKRFSEAPFLCCSRKIKQLVMPHREQVNKRYVCTVMVVFIYEKKIIWTEDRRNMDRLLLCVMMIYISDEDGI